MQITTSSYGTVLPCAPTLIHAPEQFGEQWMSILHVSGGMDFFGTCLNTGKIRSSTKRNGAPTFRIWRASM